jgi:hypothetical protein
MSPTLFRERGYRFFFFSREETRMHVHIHHAKGEAKFWLEPQIELAQNYGLPQNALSEVEAMVRKHEKEIRDGWQRHFSN